MGEADINKADNLMEELIRKIEEERDKIILSYKNNPKQMFKDYHLEKSTNKGYNGRQILELLQNCDDEEAEKVLISIDCEKNVFSISNTGNPFSEKGYYSLLYSHLSSKTSGKFIGNKGLGFRSVLNWANEIKIYSNSICLTFSPVFIKQVFESDKLFENEEERSNLLSDRDLKSTVVPLPLLSYPKVEPKILENGYKTTIEIKYKEGFKDRIIEQVENISGETLLFLKYIKGIEFHGFEDSEKIADINICSEEQYCLDQNVFGISGRVSIKDNTWNIITEEQELEDKYQDPNSTNKESYQLKLAYQDDLSDNINLLFSYFITEEELVFPLLIHGTFELDQNRKHISNDKSDKIDSKNQFILERLALLMINTAKLVSGDEVSWRPLKFISYQHRNNSLSAFFDILDSAVEQENLFPCIDGTYRCRKDVVYVSESFVRMIVNIGLESFIPNHLISIDENSINLSGYDISSTIINIYDIVYEISRTTLDISERALFIRELIKAYPETKFDFLIDDSGDNIKPNEYVLTPSTGSVELRIPNDARIVFIDKELFDELLIVFEFDKEERLGKGRFIYEMLKSSCDIHSYEPATLAVKIISEINKALSDDLNENIQLIKEMNRCLYHNFLQMDEDTKLPQNTTVPILCKDTTTINITSKTFLSEYYPTGSITETIFGSIYTDSEYIASPEDLGFRSDLENYDLEKIERYMLWLGVHEYAEYYEYKSNSPNEFEYISFVRSYINRYIDNRYQVSYKTIKNIDTLLDSLSTERLLMWIAKDEYLSNQLSDSSNTDRILYKYYGNNFVESKPSYLKFRIVASEKFDFTNHLLEDKSDLINCNKIDYEAPLFIENSISKTAINNALLNLGAKDDFNSLSIQYVTSLFSKIIQLRNDGKGSQSFYKRALGHYRKNSKPLTYPVRLFAKKQDEIKDFDQNEIYYSDNIKLPKAITEKYPIFNFPSRAGGKEAIEFFRINDIAELDSELISTKTNDELSDEFNILFESLKPYILTYRLEDLKKETSKSLEASKLNNVSIELCDEIKCSISGDQFLIDDYDFFHSGNNHYLISVNQNDLSLILREPKFADSFAEILSNTFDTNSEKDSFGYVIRNDETYNKHIVAQKFGMGSLEEANELLGNSNYKLAFWETIYALKGFDKTKLLNTKNTIEIVEEDLNIEAPDINYANLKDKANFAAIQRIFTFLNIEVSEFNQNTNSRIDLSLANQERYYSFIKSKEQKLKQQIWEYLKGKSISQQELLLDEFYQIGLLKENINENANSLFREEFDVDFEKLLKKELEVRFGKYKLDIDIPIEVSFFQHFNENKKQFTEAQVVEIEKSLRNHSLLFFNNVELIKERLEKALLLKQEEEKNQSHSGSIFAGDYVVRNGVNAKTMKKKKRKPKHKKRPPQIPNVSDTDRKVLGNISEDIVREKLIEMYSNEFVVHKSKEDDSLPFDIYYSKNCGEDWIYVEVKTFYSSRFFLSPEERVFGEKNDSMYEIWLVTLDKEIIVLENFYSTDPLPILNSTEYEVIITEYDQPNQGTSP